MSIAADKIKVKIRELAEKGVPIAVLQDPISKLPSITFTFFVVAGIVCIIATFERVKAFAGINFNEIKEFFDMTMWAYLGRSAIKASLGTPSNSTETKEKQ